jgi:lipoyl(octanoyl) transferase
MIPADIEWRVSTEQVPYAESLAAMEARAAAVAAGEARELVWLLEHPPVYTGGTSADPAELIDPRFPVVQTGRGGRYTSTSTAAGATCAASSMSSNTG